MFQDFFNEINFLMQKEMRNIDNHLEYLFTCFMAYTKNVDMNLAWELSNSYKSFCQFGPIAIQFKRVGDQVLLSCLKTLLFGY